jgi:hypothetical protein
MIINVVALLLLLVFVRIYLCDDDVPGGEWVSDLDDIEDWQRPNNCSGDCGDCANNGAPKWTEPPAQKEVRLVVVHTSCAAMQASYLLRYVALTGVVTLPPSRDSQVYDVVVIGAGCIGGSVARRLAQYNLSVCVLEMSDDVTQGATKGNSGIVHAG